MKKQLLFILLIAPLISSAQLNQRFYSDGNPGRIAPLGAYGANTFLQWRQIQKKPLSSYNWSFSDMLVQAYQSAGLQLMITLSCSHPLDGKDTTPGTCAYMFTHGSGDNQSNWPVLGTDSVQWKQFVDAIVDRYDKDGNNDMPGLTYAVTQWHIIGQEWSRIWCDVPFTDTTLQYAKDFVRLVNMTYKVIKARQPQSTISYAGIDTRFQAEAFYDGYFPASQATICNSINNCSSQVSSTKAQLAAAPKFLPSRRNVVYILKNALADEIDLHQYGRWQTIPDVVRWAKDSSFGKPVIFMEGGGPFCPACEDIYHSVTDKDGRLPASLVRDNASYLVYYYITALASGVKKLHLNLPNEYPVWGATWGDLDLTSINDVPKPSYYTYRFLAKTVFSRPDADTIVKIAEANPALYHYQIDPMSLQVAWAANAADSILVTGKGQLNLWNIPVSCNSLYPTWCDSTIQHTAINVNGYYAVHLNNGIPVFYSWNDVLGVKKDTPSAGKIKVYPNPSSYSVTIETDNDLTNATLTIYNSLGQALMLTRNISGQQISLSLNNLKSGLYFIQLVEGKTSLIEKLLIRSN